MYSSCFNCLNKMRCLLLLLVGLIHVVAPITYHVNSTDNGYTTNNTLQDYINNAKKYFVSNTQLLLLPGNHCVQSDLTLQNVTNFTIIGSNSSIICNRSSVGINLINAERIRLVNISFIKCGKNHTSNSTNTSRTSSPYKFFIRLECSILCISIQICYNEFCSTIC